jgi:hypothetical protein
VVEQSKSYREDEKDSDMLIRHSQTLASKEGESEH